MRAVRYFLVVLLILGVIGWLNGAPAREVGLDALDSSETTQQVARSNHDIAASPNWINELSSRPSREMSHPVIRLPRMIRVSSNLRKATAGIPRLLH
jgi:hypothetical protein